MAARFFAFLVWALLAATGVFWLLRLTDSPQPVPGHAAPVTGRVVNGGGDLTRLFGAQVQAPVAAAPPESARYKLIGTVVPRAGEAGGWATIAVDDQMPHTYAVGTGLRDSDLVLQEVTLRTASLGPKDGAAAFKLELPMLPAPTTGVPGAATAAAAPGAPGLPGLPGLAGNPRAGIPRAISPSRALRMPRPTILPTPDAAAMAGQVPMPGGAISAQSGAPAQPEPPAAQLTESPTPADAASQ